MALPDNQAEQLAAELFDLLNKPGFRRCQPFAGDRGEAIARLRHAIEANKPLPLMMYWAKAERELPAEAERMAADYLAGNLAAVSARYPAGVLLDLVFVDSHVTFNGLPCSDASMQAAGDLFKEAFAKRQGLQVRLSRSSDYLPPIDFDQLPALAAASDMPAAVLQKLDPRAERYYKRTAHTPAQAATMYYELCKLEQEPMGKAFADHVFLTYNPARAADAKHFGVPAAMPAVCIHSLPGGITDKPWNIPQEKAEKLFAEHQKRQAARQKPTLSQPSERIVMQPNDTLAIAGGGLAGLMTAYQASLAAPSVAITVFEKAAEDSYHPEAGTGHRASLGASPARTIRLSNAEAGVGEWNVQETKRVIDALQAEIDAAPQDFPALAGRRLLVPEAVAITTPSADDKGHKKILDGLKRAGVACSELTGAELKTRFPGLYNTLPDTAAAVIEEPYHEEKNKNGVAGVMDVEAITQALVAVLKKRGVNFRFGEPVQVADDTANGVKITTSLAEYSFSKAVLAPGQWLETIANGKGESLTKGHGIAPRYDRVVVMDIDLKALGADVSAIPFTKGLAPKGGEGTFYSHEVDGAAGRVKFLPAVGTRSVATLDALHAPISDDEKAAALRSAALRFGVDEAQLAAHTRFSGCAYTCPKVSEKMLVAPLSDHIVFAGLDSSGSARTSGGVGSIAAHLALGRDEPVKGANDAFSLQAHQSLVGGGVTIQPAAAEAAKLGGKDQSQQRS